MERRSNARFKSKPVVYLKHSKLLRLNSKSVEQVKAHLKLIADLQKAADNG